MFRLKKAKALGKAIALASGFGPFALDKPFASLLAYVFAFTSDLSDILTFLGK